ncbi:MULTISPECIES: hypothetical protein [unclassified Chryseobacterium]|uniref:hypothetical protein n=1 Tax=unclassified Chryseobacterium TaxID=2593645 RepID=UPI001D321426|nr:MULTISPECIES: hypothetical protein [unclassified Chryseobacterium]MCQ9636821.1 hypothetical protein [Chryseobacterium sp. WG23]CAH0253794.1 hypothetical protein SRABI04_03297 [Chryseobacterium sp. Bi04]
MKKTFSEEDLIKNLSLYYLNRHLKKKPIEKYHRTIDESQLHDREKYRKKSEILLLNSFMHHFPEVKFEDFTCESPDFIAKLNDKKIGIELTEVINHLEMKKVESTLNKIFRQAEILLEQEDTTKYRGVYFLEFHTNVRFDNLEQQEENIISIYKSIKRNKAVGCVKSVRKSFHRRNVFITHEYNMNLFDELCSEKILELIEKKNEKFPYYDTSVDECWLVIVSDMNSIASRYTFIQDKEHLNEVKSPFHKIFHLENLCGNITSIK